VCSFIPNPQTTVASFITFSQALLGSSHLALRSIRACHGDEVLTRAAADALAKIASVLSQAGQEALAIPLAMPGRPGYDFPENAVPLEKLRAAIRSQTRLELENHS
jgi:predicted DNA-binding transcriptional regulator YafY